jgi:hypothetical protein
MPWHFDSADAAAGNLNSVAAFELVKRNPGKLIHVLVALCDNTCTRESAREQSLLGGAVRREEVFQMRERFYERLCWRQTGRRTLKLMEGSSLRRSAISKRWLSETEEKINQ